MTVTPAIIPCLHYEDAQGAIRFLCDALGFQRHAVYEREGDPSIVEHAELTINGQMVMLNTPDPSQPYYKLSGLSLPREGGLSITVHVAVDDVDGHAERARKHGAEILMEPEDKPYGGRGYALRDPGGYVWSFGSYDPFAPQD